LGLRSKIDGFKEYYPKGLRIKEILSKAGGYFDITAEDVAFLCKKRWGIEIQFKIMKQNFQLHNFYGENENATIPGSGVH
jgi:IS4 transposase